MTEGPKKQLGRILLQQKAISPADLDRALGDGKGTGRIASRLTEQGAITDNAALKALSEQHGIPGIDLQQICLRLEDLELLPREIAEKHVILPVLVRDDRLFVAMANPREKKVIDELEFVTGKKVYPYVALERTLLDVVQQAYTMKTRGETYYVGPNCPPEVLRKVGLADDAEIAQPQPHERRAPTPPPPPPDPSEGGAPLEAPGVVVDDLVGRASRNDDVGDEAFGDLSEELSQVTELPESELDSKPPDAKTILVVDDEEEIRKMLKRLLSQRGFRVLETDRGREALRMVKQHKPDLIVLDAMLPEVHGFEIARRIKNSERYKHIPIIMVSAVYRGWRYAEDLKQSCGVEQYIEKPFRIADVMAAVEASLAVESTPERSSDTTSREAEEALEAGVAAYKAGNIEAAVSHLTRGLAIDPLAYRLHFHLGLLFGKTGRVYEAISELETAVQINSRHFPAVKNLAILYQKAGFRNKATETWERALSLAPDEPTRQSIKDHLLSLL